MVTIVIESERMRKQFEALRSALIGSGKMGDAARMIENETKSFLRRVINFTPPPGLSNEAKMHGEGAIERDLHKLFTPVDEELLNMIGSQFGVSGIDKWITSSGGQKEHIRWDRIDPSGSGMDAFHKQNLNDKGRAKRVKIKGWDWYAPYVVGRQDFDSFMAKIKARVGLRKAAWAIGYVELGGKVQRWIARHLGIAKGSFHNGLTLFGSPSITMINRSVGIGSDAHAISGAMRTSASSMRSKMRKIIKGYAYDMANGRIISPQEMREAA